MDLHQPVVEMSRGLERLEGPMIGPVTGVIQQHSQLHADLERIDTDILLCPAELPGPCRICQ